MQHAPDNESDGDQVEAPSKSAKKREMTALQKLGGELVDLNAQQLEAMQLPEALLEAVQEAQRLNRREARRRQMQFIGRLMRDLDAVPIRDRLEQWKGKGREHTAQLHAIERWRDELLAADQALERFLAQYPGADIQQLRSLIRNARREQGAGLPPKSYRELFRVLREMTTGEGAADD